MHMSAKESRRECHNEKNKGEWQPITDGDRLDGFLYLKPMTDER